VDSFKKVSLWGVVLNVKTEDSDSHPICSKSPEAICPWCAKPAANCACREIKKVAVPNTGGVVCLRYETKGRKGKGMTLIQGLLLSENSLGELAKRLKQRLGTGGSVKNYVIELQGDQREQAARALGEIGYRVKLK